MMPSPEEARRRLALLQRVLMVLGIIYLSLHAWVSFLAFRQAGVLSAIATLVTLGFGDLYWSVFAHGNDAQIAMVAAIMAFASWLSRPWTRPYLLGLALVGFELPGDAAAQDQGDRSNEARRDRSGGAGVDGGRPGGAGADS